MKHEITPDEPRDQPWSCACGASGFDIYDLASHTNDALDDRPDVGVVARVVRHMRLTSRVLPQGQIAAMFVAAYRDLDR